MKSVLICAFLSALEIAHAIPSPEAQWGPGFDDDETTADIDVFEKLDSPCTVTWHGNQVSGTCVASDEIIPAGLISVASADCIASGVSANDGSVKCQVGPVPCGGSNNYCFNPDEAGACTGKTLSFTVNNNKISYLCPDQLVCCVGGASSSGGGSPSSGGRPRGGGSRQQSPSGTGATTPQQVPTDTGVQQPGDSTTPPPGSQSPSDSTTPQPGSQSPSDSTTPQPGSQSPDSSTTTSPRRQRRPSSQSPDGSTTPTPGDSTTPTPGDSTTPTPGDSTTPTPGDSTTPTPRRQRRPSSQSPGDSTTTPQSTNGGSGGGSASQQPVTSPTGQQPQQIEVPTTGGGTRSRQRQPKVSVAFADTGDSIFSGNDGSITDGTSSDETNFGG